MLVTMEVELTVLHALETRSNRLRVTLWTVILNVIPHQVNEMQITQIVVSLTAKSRADLASPQWSPTQYLQILSKTVIYCSLNPNMPKITLYLSCTKAAVSNFKLVSVLLMTFFVVCHAGHYRIGSQCLLCNGNTIKTTKGNALNCDEDPTCDGVSTVPNENHTTCGGFPL